MFRDAFAFTCVILILLVHFSLVISRLSDQNKVLAQRVGMLQERLEAQERASGVAGDPAEAATGADAGAGGGQERPSTIEEELSRTG